MSARVQYERLSREARDRIRYGTERVLTISDYVRHWFPGGVWGGDSCGCPDDRCIGYHHDEGEQCGCVEACAEQASAATAADIAKVRSEYR